MEKYSINLTGVSKPYKLHPGWQQNTPQGVLRFIIICPTLYQVTNTSENIRAGFN